MLGLPAMAGHQGQAVRYERSHQERTAEQGLSLRKSPPWVTKGLSGTREKTRKCGVMETKGAKTFEKLEVTCIA